MNSPRVRVPYNYLPLQFANYGEILNEWDSLIKSSEFTLGPFVEGFEATFADYVGAVSYTHLTLPTIA